MKVNRSDIKSNPNNPRVIKDDKYKKLLKSIKEFPDMLNKRPLVCFTDKDGKYVVLGGNMRLKAITELNIKEVEIILADEWTEEQKQQFIIKDNVGYGEWDWDNLANEWDVEKLNEWGLDTPDEWENPDLDYSDKNKEININELGDISIITFKYDYQTYLATLDLLNNAKEKLGCDTNEETLLKLLSNYE